MTIKVYKLDDTTLCISTSRNRMIVSESMIDDNIVMQSILGEASPHLELLATLKKPFSVGDVLYGDDLDDPSIGMVIRDNDEGYVYLAEGSRLVGRGQYKYWRMAGDESMIRTLPLGQYTVLYVEDENN